MPDGPVGELFQLKVETFPIAFGVPEVADGDRLNCIASAGGHDLLNPQNREQLVAGDRGVALGG